jgi:hypothetical protein
MQYPFQERKNKKNNDKKISLLALAYPANFFGLSFFRAKISKDRFSLLGFDFFSFVWL